MQTTLKELRRGTGAIVRAVERGETVVITNRGRPVAEISAIGKAAGRDDDKLFGIWRNNKVVTSVQDYMAKVRKGRS